jgi:hypothetical protein
LRHTTYLYYRRGRDGDWIPEELTYEEALLLDPDAVEAVDRETVDRYYEMSDSEYLTVKEVTVSLRPVLSV